jgi:NADPH:quinone reductase-like Zn-dependent oxidoreductase
MRIPALASLGIHNGTMKAMVSRHYGEPEVLAIEEVAKPAPKTGELLIRNRASVVTAAMCHARAGSDLSTRLYFGLRKPKWPILGTNFSGVVEAVGSSVTRFRVGDRVAGTNATNFGAFAEYIVVADDGAIVPRPTNLSDGQTVAVFDGAVTALPFLREVARLQSGQSVLINSASGAVGTAAIQLAKHFGATVTAVCSTANLELVKAVGADAVIDYTAEDFTRNLDSYDIIFDTVAASSFLRSRRARRHLPDDGAVVGDPGADAVDLPDRPEEGGNRLHRFGQTGRDGEEPRVPCRAGRIRRLRPDHRCNASDRASGRSTPPR